MLYDPKWEKPVETKPLETWQRLLLGAAAIIEERGLRQHGFGGKYTDREPVCALRALDIAAEENGGGNGWGRPRTAIMAHVGCDSVVNWVDAPGRTQEEVLAAMRGAVNADI
jgi:hypothetical protein